MLINFKNIIRFFKVEVGHSEVDQSFFKIEIIRKNKDPYRNNLSLDQCSIRL